MISFLMKIVCQNLLIKIALRQVSYGDIFYSESNKTHNSKKKKKKRLYGENETLEQRFK